MKRPRVQWDFVVDERGYAAPVAADALVAIETVQPGEYLITLPLALEFGLVARIADDAGFISATPGDDSGNKPRVVRVLTLTPQHDFGPRDFTLEVTGSHLLASDR
jgi:hypothetical protein